MGKNIKDKKLSRDFYTRELLTVAKELLGKKFVRLSNNNLMLSGKIVEVEAYDGSVDQAAHTFKGKTPRNEVMFGQGGYLYVYFTYGMYYCCNIVTGNENEGKAVLIRAIEPLEGIVQMAVNRFQKDFINDKELRNLANGPGKLCMAFGITKEYNGTDLLGERIFLLDQKKIPEENIISTTRIGITKSVELPWRFYIKNNPYVSHR
ncbi:MAG: DNA-3-methyladenine glycosylase [Bacteroidota bacterium]|nr:DNA-3-methyladenine glycosylase [Bacteroidota bacterium]MDP4191556.1 DNA-3-methyladenine glycosylase [Bacteroidota bacterium]MDP4195681.1 DNA-3-methyladenine glycosylase [Bacteroidota bacterium]